MFFILQLDVELKTLSYDIRLLIPIIGSFGYLRFSRNLKILFYLVSRDSWRLFW